MSLLNQKTIKKAVSFTGIGLHSGKQVKICIKPSDPDTGIVFKRVDLKENNLIFPNFTNVSNTALNTTISNDSGASVSTIEHLMGALFGIGIDNVLVEIDNEEVPILDGSAKQFIEKILSVGLISSDKPIKIIKINKKIEFRNKDKFISIEPSKLSLDIDFQLKYQNKIIGDQRNKINVYEDDLTEIFNSRTFCLYEDIEAIKKKGLAKEFVNHKILDCIGDLFTSGYRMIASIKCSQGGHYLTNNLLREVFANKDNFSIIEIQERTLPHTLINRSLLRSIA